MPKCIELIDQAPQVLPWGYHLVEKEQYRLEERTAGLLHYPSWCAHKEHSDQAQLQACWLDSEDDVTLIHTELAAMQVIALNFPVFTDGRAYSTARLLREQYGFAGELWAVGDVLLDQLLLMKRCGFTGFVLREDQDITRADAMLSSFSQFYQAAYYPSEPLYRRRLTGAG